MRWPTIGQHDSLVGAIKAACLMFPGLLLQISWYCYAYLARQGRLHPSMREHPDAKDTSTLQDRCISAKRDNVMFWLVEEKRCECP